jgi:N-glycosylase/DNA lyase
MIVDFEKNKTVLLQAYDFDLEHIFACGQCFRFDKIEGGFEGVALGRVLRVTKTGDTVTLFPCTAQDYHEKWNNYFDLNRDYACLFEGADSVLLQGLRCGAGLRILNQPPFETLISFIISANNNVKRIRGIIRKLCEQFGRPFTFEGRTFYDFPTPRVLANLGPEELSGIGAGYRAPYIVDASKMIAGGFDLELLRGAKYPDAKRELMRLAGVGPKVADCVLLFSLGHSCAFPADVWIKRVLAQQYGFKGNDKQTAAFAIEKFGKHAGIAQQYLFYWIRGRENA